MSVITGMQYHEDAGTEYRRLSINLFEGLIQCLKNLLGISVWRVKLFIRA